MNGYARRLFVVLCVATWTSAASAQEAPWLQTVTKEGETSELPSEEERKAAELAARRAAGATLEINPSVFSRYELRRGYDRLGVGNQRFRDFDAVAYRARFQMALRDVSLGQNASLDAVLTPQASGFWGPSGLTLTDRPLDLHEGYVQPRFGDVHWLQLGRFEMTYGDEWLIGPVGWHETGRSFDGGRLHLESKRSGAWFDFFASALQEGRTNDPATTVNDRIAGGDLYLLGGYTDLGPLVSPQIHLDLYALTLIARRTSEFIASEGAAPVFREGAAEATLGARVRGDHGMFGYRAEGGLQFGERVQGPLVTNTFAWAADAEVNAHFIEKLHLALEGLFASGDDPTTTKDEGWADRFSTAHKWLGLSDVMGTRTNVMGGVLHFAADPVQALRLGTQLHVYGRQYAPTDASYYGTEVDLYLGYTFLPGLVLRTDYDIFVPGGDAFADDSKPAHYLGVELRFEGTSKFGAPQAPSPAAAQEPG